MGNFQKDIKCLLFTIKSDKEYKQVIITPKIFGFVIEVQYEQPIEKKKKQKGTACIDIGVNNLCAITSDQHLPILINGRIVKSINQYYNKYPTKNNLKKRYWRIENYFHHVSKFIIQNCIDNNIGKIIIGKNNGLKQNQNHGKKNNQNFQYIPFNTLLQKIQYKALMNNIEVIYTEESYTSKSSFLDNDPLPIYEKGVSHTFSGTRMTRGRYRSKDGTIINADVNGSANIGRKVIQDKDFILQLSRSLGARPVRVNPLKSFSKITTKVG